MTILYRNIWAVSDYIYHTTDSGVDVYNSDASVLNYRIDLPEAATSVWANNDYVYMGTLTSGVYRSTISGTASPYIMDSYVTSNNIIYLHGAGDYLCLTSSSGVDRYDLSTASGTTISGASRIYTYQNNTRKCYQTVSGTLYYAENHPFYDVDESQEGINGRLRDWKYYQLLSFTPTLTTDAQVNVVFQPDFSYQNVFGPGDDIRFVNSVGDNLSYSIKEWYPHAVLVVKVPTVGTTSFYMLYGNESAPVGASEDGFYLSDEFTGTTLNTDKWQANTGSNGIISVQNGYVRLYAANYAPCEIITKDQIPYSMLIEARIRRNGGTQFPDLRGRFGYTATTAGFTARGYVYLGIDDEVHTLTPFGASGVVGDRLLSDGWGIWQFIHSDGYQRSLYDGELLEDTSVIDPGASNHLIFHLANFATHPDLNVDWVHVETWPKIYTYTSTDTLLWDLIHPKLHAIYTPNSNWLNSDYTYEEFYDSPLLLRDIHVTEETSSYNNDNTIFLATDRGAYVIEERQGDEENSTQKRYYIN